MAAELSPLPNVPFKKDPISAACCYSVILTYILDINLTHCISLGQYGFILPSLSTLTV